MSTQCTSTRLEQCCAEVMSITMAEATAAMFCITTQGTCLSHLEACNDALCQVKFCHVVMVRLAVLDMETRVTR